MPNALTSDQPQESAVEIQDNPRTIEVEEEKRGRGRPSGQRNTIVSASAPVMLEDNKDENDA